jgi:hypothetical protein
MIRTLSFLLIAMSLTYGQTSDLWGVNGERWNPRSRLPDFSYVGYHSGETLLPTVSEINRRFNVAEIRVVAEKIEALGSDVTLP